MQINFFLIFYTVLFIIYIGNSITSSVSPSMFMLKCRLDKIILIIEAIPYLLLKHQTPPPLPLFIFFKGRCFFLVSDAYFMLCQVKLYRNCPQGQDRAPQGQSPTQGVLQGQDRSPKGKSPTRGLETGGDGLTDQRSKHGIISWV